MNDKTALPKEDSSAARGREFWTALLLGTPRETVPARWGGGAILKPEPSDSESIPSATAGSWVKSNSQRMGQLMTKKKEKLEMPVCTRVSASKYRTLETWCDNSFRKRSEVVGMVLERVLDLIEQQAWVDKPVEDFVRHLRANGNQ